jgi:hypothetical protein
MGFRAGVPDPVLTANVTWLARYRHPRCGGPPGLARLLLEVFAEPAPLMAGAAAAGDPIAVLPALLADRACKAAIAYLASQASPGIQPRPVTKRRSRQASVVTRNPS